jgi:serine/threonine-protein kinase RsbW
VTPCLELTADYEAARQIGPWLANALDELSAPHIERIGEIELALHELAINIVDHAYENAAEGATYTISLTTEADQLRVVFCDQGRAFVDDHTPPTDEPTIRGYGLFIVEQLASSIYYERVGADNRWTLVFSS